MRWAPPSGNKLPESSSQARTRWARAGGTGVYSCKPSQARMRWARLVHKNLRARRVVGVAMGTGAWVQFCAHTSPSGRYAMPTCSPKRGGQIGAAKSRRIYSADFSAQHIRPGAGAGGQWGTCGRFFLHVASPRARGGFAVGAWALPHVTARYRRRPAQTRHPLP